MMHPHPGPSSGHGWAGRGDRTGTTPRGTHSGPGSTPRQGDTSRQVVSRALNLGPTRPAAGVDLSGLDPEQLRAATAPRGPVCIIAGAGTGKTRTITHRIAHLIDGGFVNPSHVLAVSFTRRAASEMRERLERMQVPRAQADTFHSAALRQLRHFWPAYADTGGLLFEVNDRKYPLVARAARMMNIEPSRTMVRDMIGEIEWSKSSIITPDDYPTYAESHRRDCPVPPEQFARVFALYEQLKDSGDRLLLDFDDILFHIAAAIESSPAIAEEFRARYRSFVVDEYQDVTPLQQRVLNAWLGDRDDITVVGDPNQTIYSFNGASPTYLLNFARTYPHATVVQLYRDYRSTPQVVEVANKTIAAASGRVSSARLRLQGQRPAGPVPTFTEYPDDQAEATAVAQRISALVAAGTPASEIAVLYRTNNQSEALEYALDQAGIGYLVKGGEGFFERSEVREGMSALRFAAQQAGVTGPEADAAAGGTPGPKNHAESGSAVGAVAPSGAPSGPAVASGVGAAVRAALAPVGLTPTEPTGAQERQRWQSLASLARLADELAADIPGVSLHEVYRILRSRADAKNPPRVDGVTLASIHAAKGLEWDAVFLVGLAEGLMPIRYALKGPDSAEAIEEERRLLYVGITRAREHLALSWAVSRQEGGRANRKRSRFLDGIVPGEQPGTGAPHSHGQPAGSGRSKLGAPKHQCGVCGARLATPELRILERCGEHVLEPDHLLVEKLREWRNAAAEEAGQPAFVIMTNATLKAIAQAKPRTEQELLQVPGMGPIKVQNFGPELLPLLANYA